MKRISVGLVEPDREQGRELAEGLIAQSARVLLAPSLMELQRHMRERPLDVIVLGPSLVSESVGLSLALRSTSDDLICVLGSPDNPEHVVEMLRAGADAHLSYPADLAELVARLTALARRKPRRDMVLQSGDIAIRLLSQSVLKRNHPLRLTKIEFRLLLVLMRHMGRPLDRAQLIREVWGYEYLGRSRLVDMGIKRLRDKIEDDPSHPRYIVTARGGYYFSPEGRGRSGRLDLASGSNG
ncbi:MAG: response regulator transcription factor [Actinomycetota bacterium]